ncbi:PLP-dependent aminotransferase family protein [Acinetobacter sp. WU_MDCI_Abxc222]|uniref:aminotransferase-like domain-containing protein n=1 Tax=Acinetobacter sp. WU_MDCI_Abxc222 TaxID=2850076 RepID=UPI0021CD4DD3|nr:PLP-dependent aminotransferase family protein [Acinetobacter sp. WU_MDCI_Abxc222]MCU4563766.1 PLP-dependent aminotransferase family protein [Acinetobacter sp. WU_MDCI_Abxc222]
MLSQKSASIKSSAVRELLKYSKVPGIISLAGGIPATDLIDVDGIDITIREILAKEHRNLFQYSVTEGEENFRYQIANWIKDFNFKINPENILITNGSQQAIDLLNRVFLDKGDKVLVERPTYLAALQLFGYSDVEVVELDYTNDKLDLNSLEIVLKKGGVKMLYLTPNFANPSGKTIDYETRVGIIKLTHRHNVVIIEDDPYGFLRFSGEFIKSLFTIAQEIYGENHNVCYMSSFSKIFSPGLRLGWTAIPSKFIQAVVVAKQALDLHTSTLNQNIAAHYIESGKLNTRLDLLKNTYKKRRDLLINSLNKYVGDELSFNVPQGGMFLWCHLRSNINAKILLEESINENVIFVPGEVFFAHNPERNSLRLSYSMISSENSDSAAYRIFKSISKLKSNKTVLSN